MFTELRADLNRYLHLRPEGVGRLRALRTLAETQGVWAITVYRFGRWSNESAPRPLRAALKAAYLVAFKAVEIATGISLPAHVRIGAGFYVGHFGAIIIHPDVVMGERCSISQGVTIGVLGGVRDGVPRLGNDVYVGAGAKVLGDITIGDGAVIGANAVVLDHVPAGATVAGVPAQVVKQRARSSRKLAG